MKKFFLVLAATIFLASCNNSSSVSQNSATGTTTAPTVKVVTLDELDAPTYGSGETRLQIWADFQCPACIQAESVVTPIFEEFADAGKLTIEYRQFPLTQMHPNAFNDAMAAMCANDQEKYHDYKKALYALETTKQGATLSDDERVALAEQNGLDSATFADCLTTKKYQEYVQKSLAAGEAQGVNGTPTYFLDGRQLSMSAFKTPDELKTFVNAVINKKLSEATAQ